MTSNDLITLFKSVHALLDGHFKLSSGRHSDLYLQCARILQYPEHARTLCSELAKSFGDIPVSGVIAPAIGGIIVAHEVAASLGVRAIFGERVNGVMTLRRGFEIHKSEPFIVVEDVITTGKSTREIIDLVTFHGGVVTGIGCLADRSNQNLNLPFEPASLLKLACKNWDPSECPLCQKEIPIETPGSRFKP
ncbi:MAG: orotate phosphoribosyltransferase [bacterium]